ncbi:MAG: RNA methyltransferase [Firmicutes bacterium]|nr:RNA methyltransferase [Bacillota bacterium]
MKIISSKDNQKLKLARSLRQKKGRMNEGCFLAEGLRLCGEALLAGIAPRCVFAAEDASAPVLELAKEAEAAGAECYRLSSRLLAGIADTEHSQGIVMVLPLPQEQSLPEHGHCYALCDGLADPGNVGAVFRSAYAAEVSGLILSPGCADPYNPKTVRSAMGAIFRMPFVRTGSDGETAALIKKLGVPVYVTAMDGKDIRGMKDELRQPHLWVLGSEAAGVSAFWRRQADAAVSLPMRQGAESLNVAAAAAVLFYQSFFAK